MNDKMKEINDRLEIDIMNTVAKHLWGLRALTRAHFVWESCIPTSETLAKVFHHFGMISYPVVARVIMFDDITGPVAREYGYPFPEEKVKEIISRADGKGKVVMIGLPKEGEKMGGFVAEDNTWIGHMVTVVRAYNHWHMIDLTLDQANKTEGIAVPPIILGVPDTFILGVDEVIYPFPGSQGFAVYKCYPQDKTFLETASHETVYIQQQLLEQMVAYLQRLIVPIEGDKNEQEQVSQDRK
jgi:hypothetical protein